jgi:putative membrane protein insertion efficiency factor
MGRGDSSAEFGGDGGICEVGGGAGEADAAGVTDSFGEPVANRRGDETFRHRIAEEFTRMSVAGNASTGAAASSMGTRSAGPASGKRPIAVREEAKSAATWVALAFVRFYQIFLSPFLGGACKFYPSCSNYAQEAIAKHGAKRGGMMALKRLGRCRPFTQGGVDLVPDELDGDAK